MVVAPDYVKFEICYQLQISADVINHMYYL